MEEVDKIITHTLHQIDDYIEANASLNKFTPELAVRAVSSCLYEIMQPKCSLPRSLPVAMAQRFTVATTLAEACTANGYRSDIGYQTFLYPNAVELRRLFMFLIEQLPRENNAIEVMQAKPLNDYEMLQREIREKIRQQLTAPWVPQFARAVANRRAVGCSSQCFKFSPQLNLNVPGVGKRCKELQQYLEQQAPNIFQQTSSWEYDLVSSVIHKNDMERFGEDLPDSITLLGPTTTTNSYIASPSRTTDSTSSQQTPSTDQNQETNISTQSKTPLELLNQQVNDLRLSCETEMVKRKEQSANIATLKSQQLQAERDLQQLRPEIKIHERTCLVLAEPEENVPKLEALIDSTKNKRQTLEQQWLEYRKPMLENLKELKSAKQAKNIQNVIELRQNIDELQQELREKVTLHAQLSDTLKRATQNTATRKEFTRRIHEFIGNIRKQRADIFKVLDDTRDLQKQLNLVGAQLQRQFNYTEDLLFQSAKHDLHAKKAYKLLANVHDNCNELVEFVTLTGNVSKEIRDLEVQIDNEKMKNIAMSLMQISADITKFEQLIKELQTEIHTVENEITAG